MIQKNKNELVCHSKSGIKFLTIFANLFFLPGEACNVKKGKENRLGRRFKSLCTPRLAGGAFQRR